MSAPEVSLVVPAYNEARLIEQSLRDVLAYVEGRPWSCEVLLVDDGSTDATRALALACAARDRRVRVLGPERNRGKGYAVRSGVANSRGRCVVFFDADLAYPLTAIDDALARLEAGADVVIGARDLAEHNERDLVRASATWVFNALVERALHLGVRDTQCGFKAFRGEVARPLFAALRATGFSFDVELLWLARRWGLSIERMPLGMRHGASSAVQLARDSSRMLRDVAALVARERRGDVPQRPAELTRA